MRVEAPLAGGFGRLERMAVLTAICFGLALFAAAVLSGRQGALAALRAVSLPVIGLMLCMSTVNYGMRGLRWLVFSRALRVDVPARANALYYVAGFSMTTTPGKLGEALRLWFLRRLHGYRYADTLGLLIADRLWDALALATVLCLSVAWHANFLGVSLLAAGMVGAGAFICLNPSLLLALIGLAARLLPARRRHIATWRRSLRKLRLLVRPDVFGLGLVFGVAGWLSEGLSLYVLMHATGAHITAMACVFIFAFSMIVGAVSMLPGGLGSTEATMAGLLTYQGIKLQTAIVAVALVRVTTLWFAVGLGMLALAICLRRVRHAPMPA
jgi:uncharacterized membrane protein YbhN (UPF0104 family)